jgi:hypothetical protein
VPVTEGVGSTVGPDDAPADDPGSNEDDGGRPGPGFAASTMCGGVAAGGADADTAPGETVGGAPPGTEAPGTAGPTVETDGGDANGASPSPASSTLNARHAAPAAATTYSDAVNDGITCAKRCTGTRALP